MPSILDQAPAALKDVINENDRRKKIAFEEYIDPFFKQAEIVCGDALSFYGIVLTISKEMQNEKFSDNKLFREFIDSQRNDVSSLRGKMLVDRISLERRGSVINGLSWIEDPHLQLAMEKLVTSVLYILREYDGIGSRPKTLLDGLDTLQKDKGLLLEHLGGLIPLIESAESSWGVACQTFEQIRIYVKHGIRPIEWGGNSNVVIRPRRSKFMLVLWRMIRLVFFLVLTLIGIFAVIATFSDTFKNVYMKIQSNSGISFSPRP